MTSVFECLICGEGYTLLDASKGRYFVQTRVCSSCYSKGQKADANVWCFGKKEIYSTKRIECSTLCKDREICRFAILKGVKS